jgi:hypothetical protein
MGDARRRRERGETPSKVLAKRWLIPQEGRLKYMVYEVLTRGGKRFRVGEGIGRDAGSMMTETAQTVFARLMALEANNVDVPVTLLEIAKASNIEHRLRWVFELTSENSLIMIVCGSSAVIDGLLDFMEWDRSASTYDTVIPDRRDPDFEAISAELARTGVWQSEIVDLDAVGAVPHAGHLAAAQYLAELEPPAHCLTCRADVLAPRTFAVLSAAVDAETAYVSTICDDCARKPFAELEADCLRAYGERIKNIRKVEIHPTGGTA